jgi:sugar/nucleoside kinase (ribokinase family)
MTSATHYDVTAFGELVIDLVPIASERGLAFAAKPGGAPGNVVAGIARLGLTSAMLSKLGGEAFGAAIIEALAGAGVETRTIVQAPGLNTTLAVVTLTAEGDRDFFFYREGAADTLYAPDELALDVVQASRILHVGSLSLATPVSAAAQRRAVQAARDAGALISADPNFRPAFWRDLRAMHAAGSEVVAAANIVKVSEEELQAISGLSEIRGAVRAVWHPGLMALAVTKGPGGAELFTGEHHVTISGFPVDVVDTVGSGDAFMASFLAGLIEAGMKAPDRSTLEVIGLRACAAGAVMATVAGALENMPTRADVDRLLRSAAANNEGVAE